MNPNGAPRKPAMVSRDWRDCLLDACIKKLRAQKDTRPIGDAVAAERVWLEEVERAVPEENRAEILSAFAGEAAARLCARGRGAKPPSHLAELRAEWAQVTHCIDGVLKTAPAAPAAHDLRARGPGDDLARHHGVPRARGGGVDQPCPRRAPRVRHGLAGCSRPSTDGTGVIPTMSGAPCAAGGPSGHTSGLSVLVERSPVALRCRHATAAHARRGGRCAPASRSRGAGADRTRRAGRDPPAQRRVSRASDRPAHLPARPSPRLLPLGRGGVKHFLALVP